MAKIGRRKYPAIYNADGTWYTGWEGDVGRYPSDGVTSGNDHIYKNLLLTYKGYGRGRSAANIYLAGSAGREYAMSMSGFDLLMKLVTLSDGELAEQGLSGYKMEIFHFQPEGRKWFNGRFCQTKQGQNYFIEPCEA